MSENLAGQAMGRYTLQSLLQEDSLGGLYRAHDPTLERDVAIKVIRTAIANQPQFAENFIQAARQAARLDHPNLVQVLDFGESRPYDFIVMEYIPGGSLGSLLHEMRQAGQWILLSEAVQIVRQLALAMEYVRNQGAPRHSIAPDNLKIKPVQSAGLPYLPVIIDLGIGQLAAVGANEAPGLNPAYRSPEGIMGRPTDARSDVYALGVLLFELVTGQLPFPIETMEDALRYHTRQPLPPPGSLRPDLPAALEQVIIRALEKNPDARFATPTDFSNELGKAMPAVTKIHTPPPAFESAASLLNPFRESLEGEPHVPPIDLDATRPSLPHEEPVQAVTRRSEPVYPNAEVILENSQLSVEPGEAVATTVTLLNQGEAEGRFRLAVEGVPNAWLTCSPPVVTIPPGEQREIRMSIRPPRNQQSRAGRYTLIVRAFDQLTPGRAAETRGALTIGVYSQFTSTLQTQRITAGEVGQVAVSNQSNAPETFNIDLRDPSGTLAFNPPSTQLRLEDGQNGIAEFRAGLRSPHLFGSDRLYPYLARVTGGRGEAQTHSGEVLSHPLVPGWMLGIILFVFVCAGGALILALGRNSLAASQATQAVYAAQTGTAVALQATISGETATALFLENANQATVAAVTATAAWLAADSDNDGLSNQQEQQLGTLPDNPDTDRDGLIDGQEVQLGTDPLRPDTDRDGLPDGVEVQRGLNPLNADSDGDGIPDGQDPAPLVPSTPTPNIQATNQTNANQTAVAAQATQAAAATAQVATAIAAGDEGATSTAQAAATLSAAQTATAIAAATQAAGAPQAVVYIYLTAPNEASDYQNLLQDNGFTVDTIPEDAIGSTDFSGYRAIILGPDTGSQDVWGDPAGDQGNRLLASGLPIIGLGEGGFAFFGRAGMPIGYNNGITGNQRAVFALDPNNPIWTTPNPVTLQDQTVNLYNGDNETVSVTLDSPVPDVAPVARLVDDQTHYPIIRQGNRFLLWGFSDSPTQMTEMGQNAFVNMLRTFVPQP